MNGLKSTLLQPLLTLLQFQSALLQILLIVTAIFSCLRLRTPSNLLKAFLALSDLFVSLTVQPGYITYRLLENQLRLVSCFVRIMYHLAYFQLLWSVFYDFECCQLWALRSCSTASQIQWFLLFDTSCEICSDRMDPEYFVNCSKMDCYWIRSRKHPSRGMVSLPSRFCSHARPRSQKTYLSSSECTWF